MKNLFWGLFLILCFSVTLPVSWWFLAKLDFGYAYLHDQAGISQHIEHFAPQNIYRHDFENTSKETRVLLFHDIVRAIQNHGLGLDKLFYLDNKSRKNTLLIKEEIIHLKDVATLLDKVSVVLGFLLLIWLFFVFFLRYKSIRLPSAKQQLISVAVILSFVTLGAFVIGLESVFNQLHIWAFPKDNQWLFYYEESLMSTMMKAPDLFAYIAIMLFLVSVLLTVILCQFLRLFLGNKYVV